MHDVKAPKFYLGEQVLNLEVSVITTILGMKWEINQVAYDPSRNDYYFYTGWLYILHVMPEGAKYVTEPSLRKWYPPASKEWTEVFLKMINHHDNSGRDTLKKEQ